VKVVADTSPIHFLILIDQTDLLAGLFGRVYQRGPSRSNRLGCLPAVGRSTLDLASMPWDVEL
jgi:hypothetical protein